jgi:hypothetical protein
MGEENKPNKKRKMINLVKDLLICIGLKVAIKKIEAVIRNSSPKYIGIINSKTTIVVITAIDIEIRCFSRISIS